MMRNKLCGILLVLVITISGCTTHYCVTDLSSGTEYYTTSVKHRGSGAVTFTDANTESSVTLQNTKVTKISPERFAEKVDQ